MKHNGNFIDFTNQRNKELMLCFRKAYDSHPYSDIHKIFETVVSYPCSRFWVSEERALLVVSALLKGLPILDTMLPSKREMFLEIFRRTSALLEQNPDKRLSDIVFDVVNSQAPKFYLTPGSALVIYYKIRQGHYDNRSRL